VNFPFGGLFLPTISNCVFDTFAATFDTWGRGGERCPLFGTWRRVLLWQGCFHAV